jgi:hypothetical protein
MKKREFTFGIIAVLLALFPLLILLKSNTEFIGNLSLLQKSAGSLLTLTVLYQAFGGEGYWMKTWESAVGSDLVTSFKTIPLVVSIFIIELLICYLMNIVSLKVFIAQVTSLIGFMLFVVLLLGADYALYRTKTSKTTETT